MGKRRAAWRMSIGLESACAGAVDKASAQKVSSDLFLNSRAFVKASSVRYIA